MAVGIIFNNNPKLLNYFLKTNIGFHIFLAIRKPIFVCKNLIVKYLQNYQSQFLAKFSAAAKHLRNFDLSFLPTYFPQNFRCDLGLSKTIYACGKSYNFLIFLSKFLKLLLQKLFVHQPKKVWNN